MWLDSQGPPEGSSDVNLRSVVTRDIPLRGHRAGALLAVAALVVTTAGCQSGGQAGAEPEPEPPVPPVAFQASVRENAKDVRPDNRITVSASQGVLHAVALTDLDGKEFQGEMQSDGSWRLSDLLAPGTPYRLKATGESEDGTPGEFTLAFATLVPKVEATYRVTPDGQTVGVGMPVMVTFDSAVMTPQMRANVERRMTIKTEPKQEGSWGWHSERELFWRPKEYWKPNTKVTVNAPLSGVQTGDKKWIAQDKGATFTIAKRARISTVDVGGHQMTVRENGKVIRTYPISSGQATASWRTRSGTKIITEKQKFMVMDAATLGVPEDDPDYYRTEVDFAMRVTNTGEFLHSAPWSVWAQGRRNVSHGCVNMSPSAAREMFNASIVGDVVDFVNSPRPMKMHEGVGVWLVSYDKWKARSALAKKATAKPSPAKPAPSTSTATKTDAPAA